MRSYTSIILSLLHRPSLVIAPPVTSITKRQRNGFGNTIRRIKLLIVLRNPVDRAFAHWNMQRFRGREPLDFFDAVRDEKTRITGAPPAQARRFAYIDRGFYGQQLARLFKFFPRDQVKAVKFEEFRDKQRETLTSIFSFLGLEPLRSVRSKDRNVVPYARAMNWEERIFLYNLFAEDIAKVEQLLGWDCSDWKL